MTIYTKYYKKQYNDSAASSGFQIQRSSNPPRGIQKTTSTCFKCRKQGHLAKDCIDSTSSLEESQLKCYTCGQSDHTSKSCPEQSQQDGKSKYQFAVCFVCKEKGHIASECSQNPNGGGCRHCASNQHLAKKCPKKVKRHVEGAISEAGLEESNSMLHDVDERHISTFQHS